MEQYVVSSRKYRPVTFDTVVSQAHVTATLKNAIRSNHLAQAFLFCGPRGVGKTTCARILAKTINCLNLSADLEPCNSCDSCKSFNQSANFNIYELDAASNNSVDDIRALVDQVRYAPQGAKYKVYIIDEVHMLSSSAFNAFLKTLEEPPPYAIFILATTERHKILPTILSRCQVFNFNRITVEEIVGQLKKICEAEDVSAEEEALYTIARKADGAMRDALTIFDQMVSFAGNHITYTHVANNLNILDYEYYFKMTDAMLSKQMNRALILFDEILLKGFDAHIFLNGLSEHFRNLLICKDQATLKLLEVPDTAAEKYKSQSSQSSAGFLLNALNIANQADIHYKTSRNTRLHVEMALIKMCHILSAIQLAAEDAGKKKTELISNAAKPVAVAAAAKKNLPDTPQISLGIDRSAILKTMQQKKNPAPVSPAESIETHAELRAPAVSLNDTLLEESRKMFRDLLISRSEKNVLNNFEKIIFSFSGANEISLTAGGMVPKLLEDLKSDYQIILKQLTGTKIEVKILAIKAEQAAPVYFTNDEKFRKLLEEHPHLREMARILEIRPD